MPTDAQRPTFDQWLHEHAGILHRVASGFAAGADQDDLMQEMLLALWRAVPAFAGQSKPSTFIYRVAHNAALTWRRGAVTYRRQLERFATEPLPAPDPPRPGEDEALAAIYAAIRRLPPVDRSLLVLHLDGLGYAAIAEIHGLSENHVGVRLTRLRQRLTLLLQETTDELR